MTWMAEKNQDILLVHVVLYSGNPAMPYMRRSVLIHDALAFEAMAFGISRVSVHLLAFLHYQLAWLCAQGQGCYHSITVMG